jgi:two-component sensor histidine kinase
MPPAASPEQMQSRLKALAQALEGRGVCILHQTTDHRFDHAEHLPVMWPTQQVLGKREADFMPEQIARSFSAAVEQCLQQQQLQTLDLEMVDNGRSSSFRAQIVPDAEGVLTILSNITEERTREAAMVSLLREVSHRSKNLLAIVQSVAMQTAHHSGDIQEFLRKFRGRLHALSSTQDLVTESDWRGTRLHALVSSQVSRVGQLVSRNLHITGEDPLLGPNASLHLGLAIHELAANAVAHGGLAGGRNGNIWINASIDRRSATSGNLLIEWLENGSTAQRPDRKPRFGTLVLERIVPLSVAGTAQYSIDDDQVIYRLTVPASQFDL